MPQYCRGLQDPSGNPPRPCIFAADGNGGRAEAKHHSNVEGCAFCCAKAFERAAKTRLGKRNIVARIKQWREMGSPVFDAVFTFGIPGICLSDADIRDMRQRAGQYPTLNHRASWLYKKRARLMAFLHGKPIPAAPHLSLISQTFFNDCLKNKPLKGACAWTRVNRANLRRYHRYREHEHTKGGASKKMRQQWWQLRRELRARLLSARAHLAQPILAWAADEGIIEQKGDSED